MQNKSLEGEAYVFEFKPGNMSSEKSIGKSKGNTAAHDTAYYAGKQTFTEIPIVYSGVTYYASLEEPVTIEQIEHPLAVTYTNVPESMPVDKKPTNFVSKTGSTITIELPAATWTATIKSPSGAEPNWNDPVTTSIRTDYSQYGSYRKRYNHFVWTKYYYTGTADVNVYDQQYEITGWFVNEIPYTPGQTITLEDQDADITVRAVYSTGEEVFVGTEAGGVVEKTMYGYVAGSTDQKSAGNGYLLYQESGISFSSSWKPTLGPVYSSVDDWTNEVVD
jgi:hypothetical protein